MTVTAPPLGAVLASETDATRPLSTPERIVADRTAWIAGRTALLERAARPATIAATTLASEAAGDPEPDPGLRKEADADDDRPPWRRGRAGTAVGRAVHGTLQAIDLATGDGLDATALAQARAEPRRSRAMRARCGISCGACSTRRS
jgi:hypothetical protein